MNSKMSDIYPLIEEGVNNNLEVKLNVYGRSMEPFIYNGENVTLKKDSVYKKNDIILYKRDDGHFVLHRIYKVKKDSFDLVGDHQSFIEHGIRQDQIIAKVINYEHLGKVKYLKGFKYHLYLLIWNRMLIRRVILKIKRIKENKKNKKEK